MISPNSHLYPEDLARSGGDESEDEEEEKMDHTGSRFVILERNKFRKVGDVLSHMMHHDALFLLVVSKLVKMLF